MSLSSGQSFKIEYNNETQEYDFPYRKLKDLRVFYLNEGAKLKIVYKNGIHEYVDYESGLMEKRISPNGLETFFEYSSAGLEEESLWRIYDKQGRELSINWWDNKYTTTISDILNGKEIQKILLHKTGDGNSRFLEYIEFINVDTQEAINKMSLGYEYKGDIGLYLLYSITHPTGMKEKVTYSDQGHFLPSGAPISHLPYVLTYEKECGENQENMSIRYDFSDRNYLGHGGEFNWKPEEDNLFFTQKNYKYTSTEIINGVVRNVRTYNKYHLLDTLESYYGGEDDLVRKEEYEYFADLEKDIEAQSPKYSLMKQESITHYKEGKSKSFVKIYDYDEYANPIFMQDVDGSIINTFYYPKEGEAGMCPAEPNGMVSLMKKQEWISKDSAADPRFTEMTYLSLQKLHDSSEYFVLLNESSQSNGHTETYLYYDNKSEPLSYGREKNYSLLFMERAKHSIMYMISVKNISLRVCHYKPTMR